MFGWLECHMASSNTYIIFLIQVGVLGEGEEDGLMLYLRFFSSLREICTLSDGK